ncbi:MAG: SUMF1/EgtB/PvdO family nonheme iron enzyme [Nannocystaceae bacterium]|nr:SUMF1/EgtB/PvdO family nonheme iron enzyme [bacterium]
MRPACLLLCALAAACQEPTPPPAVEPEPPAPTARAKEDDPAPAAPAAVTLALRNEEVAKAGSVLGALRPAVAPGRVDDGYAAVYDHPALAGAFADAEQRIVEAGPEVTVGALRQLWSSAVQSDGSATLNVGDASVELGRSDAPTRVLRPRGDAWTLYEDEAAVSTGTLGALELQGAIAIDVLDTATLEPVLAAAEAIIEAGGRASLAFTFAPCVEAPEGMACVPGGPAIVGYDDGLPEEAPSREIVLSTYYVDVYEVTNAQYDACHEAGACRVRINRTQNIMKPFVGEDQPAMPMDWHRARSYCAWAGKRLPTEWEWEKAARGPDGDLYPWGDEEPTCERAVFRECAPYGCKPYPGKAHRWDCNEHATKPVGSFPAGHYGLHEMAGNGYEWTSSAGVESVEACGEACSGLDPQGLCDGAYPCKGTRILRGGSWYWPKHRTRGSHRRLEKLKTGSHRLGMRCATDNPYLTAFPPVHLTEARPAPATLAPPSEDALAAFASVPDDPIEDKKICGAKVRADWGAAQAEGGRSETTCRDPFPYIMTNEPRSYLWNDYVENLGGAYVGIGSDQNYSTIAAARSQWAWVMDYDPRVVKNHRRVFALIEAADSPEAFVEFFSPAGRAAALKVIDAAFDDDTQRRRQRAGFMATAEKLYPYYQEKRKAKPKAGDYGWLAHAENYAFIRTLIEQGRLRVVGGDLLREGGALAKIGEAARALDVPVRIYYTSNAPSSWGGEVTEAYRANVLGLPMDARSVVLQTNSRGGFKQTGKWHHSVSWGRFHQRRIAKPGYDTIPKLLEDRIPGHHGDVTLLGFPQGNAG